MMEGIKRFILATEHIINTKRKKHIVGGMLLSSSIFLAGLAFTVMTTKMEEDEYHEKHLS